MKILSFGSLNLDNIYRMPHFIQPGETLACLGREVACGGKGLNQSIALAASGADVWHAGCVGEDGAPLAAMLERAGVHTDHLRQVDGPSGHTVIQINPEGENGILLCPGANARVTPAQAEETLSAFQPGDLLVIQNEISSLHDIMRMAKARGLKIALNPSPLAGAETLPLALCDWLFLNEAEARFLSGCGESSAAEDALARRFPETRIIVTYGSRGAAACGAGRERLFQPAFPAKAVDTTAAGDTFEGFALGCMAAGKPEDQCLRFAAQAAAIAVSRLGAAPSIPTMAEVRAALARQG